MEADGVREENSQSKDAVDPAEELRGVDYGEVDGLDKLKGTFDKKKQKEYGETWRAADNPVKDRHDGREGVEYGDCMSGKRMKLVGVRQTEGG